MATIRIYVKISFDFDIFSIDILNASSQEIGHLQGSFNTSRRFASCVFLEDSG
jgi:hypothetical protein